jgi:hypothetical protein
LALVAEFGSVTTACQTLGIGRSTVYGWKDGSPEFAEALEKAQELGTNRLEDEAVRRALEGVDEPVFYLGKHVANVKKYSDTLLMFTLKGRRPEKWKDRVSQELTGKDGGPVQVENATLSDEIARRLDRLALPAATISGSGGT